MNLTPAMVHYSEDKIVTSLLASYQRMRESRDGMSCDLERQLPLKEPFFQLKRVPRFKVRSDLHTSQWPAYYPLSRLETASVEDLVYPHPSRSVSILIEGEIGVGKSTICHRLLQHWESKTLGQLPWTARINTRCKDETAAKIPIYIDCSGINESYFAAITDSKGFLRFIAKAMGILLESVLQDISQDDIANWLQDCAEDVELYFDNVSKCSGLLKTIEATLDSSKPIFARVLVFTLPCVMQKHRFDNLFYCYGINPEYGARILIRRLNKLSDFPEQFTYVVDRVKHLDLHGEVLRNSLTSDLLADFCKAVSGNIPQNRSDLIQCLLEQSFRSLDVALQEQGTAVDLERIIICLRQQAYEGLYRGTHYFKTSSLPESVHQMHLCDLKIIRDLHQAELSAEWAFAFTTRSFRDFLASAHVCHLLVNPMSDSFLPNLLKDKVFESLCGYCCRQLSVSGHVTVLKMLIDAMMEKTKERYVTMLGSDQIVTRGTLFDISRVLVCLRQTDFHEDVCRIAAEGFPTILEFSLEDSSFSVLQDLIHLMTKYELSTHGVVIHLDKVFTQCSLGINLARALNIMSSLTTLMLRATFVGDTSFLVHFLCETFQNNTHIKNFTLGGPFNSAENLSQAQHRRVASTFTSDISLRTLTIENCSHMHRIAYVLGCWTNIFLRLEIRRCNLEAAASEVIIKMKGQSDFYHLRLENCYIPCVKLHDVLKCAASCSKLQVLSLNLLSGKKTFSVMDVHRGTFLPAIDSKACSLLQETIVSCTSLDELALCHAAIDDVKGCGILAAIQQSPALKIVDLSGNQMTDKLSTSIIEVIHTLTSLKNLSLNNNLFSPEGRRKVVHSTLDSDHIKLCM